MYKQRIGKWNLDKKTKEAEAWAVLRLHQQRQAEGKHSVFRVRDKSVTIDDMLRYFKRKGILNPKTEVDEHGGITPPTVVCSTPPSSPKPTLESGSGINRRGTPGFVVDSMDADDTMRYLNHEETRAIIYSNPNISSYDISESLWPPEVFQHTEQLIFSVRDWYREAFENGLFETASNGNLVPTDPTKRNKSHIEFQRLCNSGIQLMNSKLFVEGRRCFSKATSLLASIVRSQHPRALQLVFFTILRLVEKGYPEISKMFRCSIREWAIITLSRGNHWIHILTQICRLDDFHLKFTIIETMRCVSDTLVHYLGQFHATALYFYIQFQEYISDGSLSRDIPALLAKGTRELDSLDLRLLRLNCIYAMDLFVQNQEIKAIELVEDLLPKYRLLGTQSTQEEELLTLLVQYQYSVGQKSKAEGNLREAIQVCARRHDAFSEATLLRWKSILAGYLRQWGRGREAAVLDAEMGETLGTDETGCPDQVRIFVCTRCKKKHRCYGSYYEHMRMRVMACF